jgi:hypothetical protein
MQAPLLVLATLSIAQIYNLWQIYQRGLFRRRRAIRERVAFMLWVMAQEDDGPRRTPAELETVF